MNCILCARRGREFELESGHVCRACAVRIDDQLGHIVRLCVDAAASIVPSGGSTVPGTSVAGSRPPINLDAVQPELTIVRLEPTDPSSEVTILECLESLERMIREERGFVPYGPASLARNTRQKAREGTVDDLGGQRAVNATRVTSKPATGLETLRQVLTDKRGDQVTLVGCVNFLRRQIAWATEQPDFAIEQFADEIALCWRALLRWDAERETPGTLVLCPTLTENGECGTRLRYHEVDERVRCHRCGAERDGITLALVAMSDGREVWLDPEAAAKWMGVSERTLYRMGSRGEVTRSHGRYLVRHADAIAG